MAERMGKMNLRVVGIVLLIVGVLGFFLAASQIQGQGAAALLPFAVNQAIESADRTWRAVQIVCALGAIVGGVLLVVKRKVSAG